MKRIVQWMVLVTASMCVCVVHARHYEAAMHEAQWTLKKTRLECRLQHKVPLYGKAVFINHAVHGMQFLLQSDRVPARQQHAEISSVTVDWKHQDKTTDLALATYNASKMPFKFSRDISITLLAQLKQGKSPTFFFVDTPGPDDEISVSLSVVHFRPAFDQFVACAGQIGNIRYADVKDTKVNFDTAKYNLRAKDSEKLDEVAAYIMQNTDVKAVKIDGHTDAVGTHGYNAELSKRRAVEVKQYLIKQKVPVKMIKMHYFGKSRPAATNDTETGRQENRRVRIEIK